MLLLPLTFSSCPPLPSSIRPFPLGSRLRTSFLSSNGPSVPPSTHPPITRRSVSLRHTSRSSSTFTKGVDLLVDAKPPTAVSTLYFDHHLRHPSCLPQPRYSDAKLSRTVKPPLTRLTLPDPAIRVTPSTEVSHRPLLLRSSVRHRHLYLFFSFKSPVSSLVWLKRVDDKHCCYVVHGRMDGGCGFTAMIKRYIRIHERNKKRKVGKQKEKRLDDLSCDSCSTMK